MKIFKPLMISLAVTIAVIGGVVFVKGHQIMVMTSGGPQQMPPETVSVIEAQTQQWPNTYTAIGTVEADEGIMISAQVPGKVKRITFQSGAEVKAGDVLIEQEAINETAQLSAAQARLKLAKTSYQRVVELKRNKLASQSELDTAQQQVDSAQGEVDDLSATLQKKLIRAPFDGRVGIRQVDLGTDLQVGTAIVSLQATNRVRVNFPVPQDWLAQMNTGLKVDVATGGKVNQVVSGVITAIGAEIHQETRNVIVQSSLDNASKVLVPGMAVTTTVTLSEPNQVLAVPAAAIIYAPYGDTLFVVEEKDGALTARQQFIQTGRTLGDFVEVTKGLKAGEKVVSAGAFKLFNNQPVVIGTKPTPEFSTTPTPSDS
ncbi:MAG TPA: efflux transporter periplasmic adaptor subunit [Rheinheimera sp.]|nr:efflux transporter periplasmic adaptor subunit [Rheinheimera sp.]